MLSRRGVRIKVMQVLFSLNRDDAFKFKEAKKRYWASIEEAFVLYLFNLYCLIQVSKEAVADGEKRKSKHLPSDEDKTFTPKIYENDLIQALESNKKLQQQFEQLNFTDKINADYIKKIYAEFASNEAYKEYLAKASVKDDHLEVLLELFRVCRKHEFFIELMDDHFTNWLDDKSVVIGTVKKTLKELPDVEATHFKEYYPDDETCKEFGEGLLTNTHKKDEELLTVIKPALQNWDHERLAVIDMILLKMALVEFLECVTIPTKVTLNEYVEVSKMYSTPKSKDFINGILDKLLKDLEGEGKINKEGRGLVS